MFEGVLTALVRGPDDTSALAGWMRPVLTAALLDQLSSPTGESRGST